MSDTLQAIFYFFTTVYILTFKFFIFIVYPSNSLVQELKEHEFDKNASILLRLEAIERSRSSNNVAPPSNAQQSPSHVLTTDIQRLEELLTQNNLELAFKVETLNSENQILQSEILVLENQAEREKIKEIKNDTDNEYLVMRNRLDILEQHVQKSLQNEDKRREEYNETQFISQDTDNLNDRLSMLQEQQNEAFADFEEERRHELQTLEKKFKTLDRYLQHIRTKFENHSKIIESTLKSDAMLKLSRVIHEVMHVYKENMAQVESRCVKLETENKFLKKDIEDLDPIVAERGADFRIDYGKVQKVVATLATSANKDTLTDKHLLQELSSVKCHYAKIELLYETVKKFIESSVFDVRATVETLQCDITLVAETIGVQAEICRRILPCVLVMNSLLLRLPLPQIIQVIIRLEAQMIRSLTTMKHFKFFENLK